MSKHSQFDSEYRAENANKRKEEREARSDSDQLKCLDEMFGEGCGAVKERARLNKRIGVANSKKGSRG